MHWCVGVACKRLRHLEYPKLFCMCISVWPRNAKERGFFAYLRVRSRPYNDIVLDLLTLPRIRGSPKQPDFSNILSLLHLEISSTIPFQLRQITIPDCGLSNYPRHARRRETPAQPSHRRRAVSETDF